LFQYSLALASASRTAPGRSVGARLASARDVTPFRRILDERERVMTIGNDTTGDAPTLEVDALTPALAEPVAQHDNERDEIEADIRRHYAAAFAGVESFRQHTWALCCGIKLGKQSCHNNNAAFGRWFKDRGLHKIINADDRAALLKMAEHPEITQEVLRTTTRHSFRMIWDEEVKPRVTIRSLRSAAKTAKVESW
jgi:hypothetical protein